MADDKEDNARPIIIIKRVKKAAHAHHGGAWKVAYADFVTAMMAFFLLLWLLQATTEEQKLGIADYFSPASVSRSKSGSGGMMGGRTFTEKGANPHDQSTVGVGVQIQLPTNLPDQDDVDDTQESTTAKKTTGGEDEATPENAEASEQAEAERIEEMLAKREEEQFAQAEEALRQAIETVPELKNLADNLMIDQTAEGMRIQIVDQEGKSMFPSGSAKMYDHTRKLIALVVDAVKQMPQQVAIKGHTDGAPFVNNEGYSNWELSTDRANSSRRALLAAGLPAGRIASVIGLADTEHLDKDDPLSPRNRRISIILLRENPVTATRSKATKKQSASIK
jgi:chemotaxis protein MotB